MHIPYHHARLAAAAYQPGAQVTGWSRLPQLSFHDAETGYHGVTFKHQHSGHVVVVHQGVDGLRWTPDWISGLQVAFDRVPAQYRHARTLWQRAVDACPDDQIDSTGHSLGGALAQLCALEFHCQATSFNGLGVSHLDEDLERHFGQARLRALPAWPESAVADSEHTELRRKVHNFRTLMDPVSRLPMYRHVGHVHDHCAPLESYALRWKFGPARWPWLHWGLAYWSHQIDRFLEIFDQDRSVNGLECQTLAD